MNEQNLFFLTTSHFLHTSGPVSSLVHCGLLRRWTRHLWRYSVFIGIGIDICRKQDDDDKSWWWDAKLFPIVGVEKLSFLDLKTTLSSPRTIHDSKCFCLKPKVCYFLAFLPAACLFVSIMNQDWVHMTFNVLSSQWCLLNRKIKIIKSIMYSDLKKSVSDWKWNFLFIVRSTFWLFWVQQ